jgi:hypothetical protein
MNERISLQIVEDRLILTAVIACPALRIPKQILEFVIDTGSSCSYLSDRDVKRLHVAIKDKSTTGEVDFGGSRYKQVSLPKIALYALKEDKEKGYHTLHTTLSALKTTKCSEKKIQTAQMLPSILGLNFLKQQKLSLHVFPSEKLAYLEFE